MARVDKKWMAAFFLMLFLGIGVSIRQPPFFMPDEGAHYMRAYEVSHLQLINLRGDVGVPIACSEYLVAAKKYNPTPNVQKKAEDGQNEPGCTVKSINTAGSYSFVPYVPAAIALRVAEALGWKVEHRLSAARAAGFVVWFSGLFAGLLFINQGRLLLGCVVLMPAFFWQLVALSADGATFAACMVYACVVLGLIQRGQPVLCSNVLWLVGIAALIGSSKGVYAPLTLFSFALWGQFSQRSWRYRLVVLSGPVVAALLVYLSFTALADPAQVYLGNNAVPAAQMKYLLDNPSVFFKIFWEMLMTTEMQDLVAPSYGVSSPRIALNIAVVIGLALAILMTRSDFGISKNVRLLAGGLSLIGFASLCLPLYLTYTPVGYASVLGIQSRYYLPVIPLVCVALAFNTADVNWKSFQKNFAWIIVLPLVILVWSVWSI